MPVRLCGKAGFDSRMPVLGSYMRLITLRRGCKTLNMRAVSSIRLGCLADHLYPEIALGSEMTQFT